MPQLESAFPTYLNGNGLLTRDYTRDSNELQEGPLRLLLVRLFFDSGLYFRKAYTPNPSTLHPKPINPLPYALNPKP